MLRLSDPSGVASTDVCAWWNLVCKGGESAANAGMSAITRSIASGAEQLLSHIVKIVDSSSRVPLADPTYRHVYYGFLGLAAPLVGVVLCMALVLASVRRDLATLGRAVVGIGVAGLGGALYIVFAQLLVAIDDWVAHGVVRVTGYNLANSIDRIAAGFRQIAGTPGDIAANALLILLMLVMLVAGIVLWFVLVLRQVAILVVVAFAPLIIAGYLWAPTRGWMRRTTEVLVALVFTKTAIFALFGIGLALLTRGKGESFSDFVGTTVLMCGACFAPLMMLRLVHFAADSQLAGEAMGTLRSGMQPVLNKVSGKPGSSMGRHDFASQQGRSPSPQGPEPVKAAPLGSPAGTSTGATGASASGATAAGGVAAGVGLAVVDTVKGAQQAGDQVSRALTGLAPPPDGERPLHGPDGPADDPNGDPR